MMNDQLSKTLEYVLSDNEYETNAIDMDDYGTMIKITRHGSDRTLYISMLENYLTDVALYDKDGSTMFQATIYTDLAKDIPPKKLNDIIKAYL